MIYLKSTEGADVRMVILETGNIRTLMEGGLVTSPDKSVLICWTPDMVWLADKILDSGGDPGRIAELVAESIKRPQKPIDRPYHETLVKKLGIDEPGDTTDSKPSGD